MTFVPPSRVTAAPAEKAGVLRRILVLAAFVIVVAVLASWPRRGLPVVVVFSPNLSLGEIDLRITSAGGALVDFGRFKGVVVGLSPDPDFTKRLYANGALWVMDGALTTGLCVVPAG